LTSFVVFFFFFFFIAEMSQPSARRVASRSVAVDSRARFFRELDISSYIFFVVFGLMPNDLPIFWMAFHGLWWPFDDASVLFLMVMAFL